MILDLLSLRRTSAHTHKHAVCWQKKENLKYKLSLGKKKSLINDFNGSLNLSSGASPALAASPARILVLLCGRASLQVDFQHGLIHKLGRAVRTRRWLLICNGAESAFRLMGIARPRLNAAC